MRLLVLLVLALLAAIGISPAPARQRAAPCSGSSLAVSFALVPGSAGAGNVVYALEVTNRSRAECFVSGLPRLQLLGRTGAKLPTHVIPANRGALTAAMVPLRPGRSAVATARFSPDVPGPGEGHPGRPCEPTAYRVRATIPPGNAVATGRVAPPTPVCEHGGLQLRALSRG